MRIACVQSFPIDYCLDYVNAIASIGEVDFLASNRALADRDVYLDPRVRLTRLAWPRHRSLANIGLLRQMTQVIRARDVDLVHFLGDDVTWLNLLPYLIGRRPTVITVHDAEPHPGDTESGMMPRFVINRFNSGATRLIVHGENIRKALVRRIGRSPDDMDVLPHVALMRYAEFAKREALKPTPKEGKRNLLFFGRIMAYKGLPVLLDAGRLVKQSIPELELVVAGRGPALDELRPRLWDDNIVLHDGFVPDRDVAQLFLDTELVVLPYIEASQSGILALAAAFGKPAIVSDVGEIGELVRSSGMGLVVPPNDPQALASAISRVLSDPALAKQLAAASAEAARGQGIMSPEVVAKRAHGCYETAIGNFASLKQRAG
ncbi:MAG: glycosyltransferase family 4 protein [Alphaproteobacteria bacterium]|nr:glycosyltransferase family 4 protein [Alphaproteobacteria bacterium]